MLKSLNFVSVLTFSIFFHDLAALSVLLIFEGTVQTEFQKSVLVMLYKMAFYVRIAAYKNQVQQVGTKKQWLFYSCLKLFYSFL